MELQNLTKYPALLFRAGIDEERFCAAVLARVTFQLDGESLRPCEEHPWKVSPGPWESPYGPMDSDEVFYKGGVDFMVFGFARAWGGKPVARVEVSVRVGHHFHSRLVVIGDRVWQRSKNGLSASPPQPFDAIPLTSAYAFGGQDVWDELPIPFPDNPNGKGYYLEEANAVGKALPNIENPDCLITRWDDRPDPVGVAACPMNSGPRLRNGIDIDEQKGCVSRIKPEYFNCAYPAMIVPQVVAGEMVEVAGVSEKGPLTFRIPDLALMTRMRFGDDRFERPLFVDQIGVEPDAGRVFITYRFPFRYRFYPLQLRECELLEVA